MKRDINVIRELLLRAEATAGSMNVSGTFETYHVQLMIAAGLIEGRVSEEVTTVAHNGWIDGLTWAGHDFLDAARDEELWREAGKRFVTSGSSWTFDILLDWLKAQIRARISEAFRRVR